MKSQKIVSDMIWRFGERICAQIVSFIVSVVLARILLPSEYGIIAMTTVFITVSNVFVTSGFGMALIQKENADDLDFTTILVFGLLFSILLYLLLYFVAPLTASFYNEPLLTAVLRVMALKLPIASINSVQQAYVSRRGLFKKFFWSTLIGTIVSGIIGIKMAYDGFGVWALVAQYLINSLMDTIILGISIHWMPKIKYSTERLKGMIGFGWRILCSDLINTVYNELRNLIIGKRYSSELLAYYNKGQQIPHLFVTNVGVAISSVLFPAMSQEQSDDLQLRNMAKRAISIGTYIMFPIMAGLAIISTPLVRILLTEKWLPAVPYLQMACFSFAFEPWSTANLQALKAKGKAGDYLKLEIEKKSIAFIILLGSIPFGVYVLAASACVYSFVAIILTSSKNCSSIGYGFKAQLMDVLPNALATISMSIILFIIGRFISNHYILIVVQTTVGIVLYIVISKISKNSNYRFVKDLIHGFIKRGK